MIAFVDPDCQGQHIHIFNSIPALPPAFNDTISSFVVLGGDWEIFDEPNFEKKIGDVFSPGVYSFRSEKKELTDELKEYLKEQYGDEGIPAFNDKISSIQLVILEEEEPDEDDGEEGEDSDDSR